MCNCKNETKYKIEFIKEYIQNNEYDCDYNVADELESDEIDEDFVDRIMNDLDIVQDYKNQFRR